MKVVILAGGFGTRISEESYLKPKPMIEIGGKPILWHIMKLYSYYGYNEFIICCGYKQNIIKEWFSSYYLFNSDVTFDFSNDNKIQIHNNVSEPWKVTLVDTGLSTMTGGRIKRIEPYINEDNFMLTYGDGVSDVNIRELVEFHNSHGKIGTLTAVNVNQRFGILDINKNNDVLLFREKSLVDGDKINGGYMVLGKEIFHYIKGDETVFEKSPLEMLAKEGELKAYEHSGFWQCMDTKREMERLEEMWSGNNPPWKVWE